MNQPTPATPPAVFSFDTHSVRTVLIDDQPWFVAADVSEALEYRDAANMVRNLDEDERGTQIVSTPSGDQEMIVINESGMYSAVLKSRKPSAKRFKKWVTAEVLPAIRKTGRYEARPYAVNPADKLTKDEADTLRRMMKEGVEKLPKEQWASASIKGWSKLKAHFGVSYREIPRAEFCEAVSLVARHVAESLVLLAAPAPEVIEATVDSSQEARFDKRCMELAMRAYPAYRTMIREDHLIARGMRTIEEWLPQKLSDNLVLDAELMASSCESAAEKFRDYANKIAALIGMKDDARLAAIMQRSRPA